MLFDTMIQVIIVLSMIPLVGFIFFYGTEPVEGRWYRRLSANFTASRVGVVLMAQKVAMLGLLGLILAARINPEYTGRDVLTVIVYSTLLILFWAMFIELRNEQKRWERPSPIGLTKKDKNMNNLAPYAKAIWGGISSAAAAFITALLPFLVDGGGLESVTAAGWLTAVLAAIVTGGGVGGTVYGVRNEPSSQ